jgi:hypothetical protein
MCFHMSGTIVSILTVLLAYSGLHAADRLLTSVPESVGPRRWRPSEAPSRSMYLSGRRMLLGRAHLA